MEVSKLAVGSFHVRCWNGGKSSAPPLLYLHGFEQHPGNAPFLDKLSETYQVRAPEHPGYGASIGLDGASDIHDIAFYLRSLIDGWTDRPVRIVGHALGGMFAAELAALMQHRAERLVLIAPYGLWSDAHPLPDPFVLRPNQLAELKWAAPENAAKETSSLEGADGMDAASFRSTNLGAATKFMWPIPDRGLSRRLQYITCPTLIVGGLDDGLVPPSYDNIWRESLTKGSVHRIAGAGHMPMFEAEAEFLDVIGKFLT